MAFQLAEAFVEFKSQGHRGVERAVDGIRQSLLKVNRLADGEVGKLLGLARGRLSAAVSVASGVARGVGKALDEYAKHEQSVRMLNAQLKMTGSVVGFTSEQLQTMAGDLQRVTRFGDEATLAAQSLLLSFTNIRGDIFKDALESAMDMSTIIGQDLKSSIQQLGKALNDPISGLTGLRRVGILFTEEQQELIRTLTESGRVMEAQKIIVAELRNEFGGAAQADLNTFQGQIESVKNAFGDLQESIGQVVAGSKPLQGVLGEVRGIIEDLNTQVSEFADKFNNNFVWVVQSGFIAMKISALEFLVTFTDMVQDVTRLAGMLPDFLGGQTARNAGSAASLMGAAFETQIKELQAELAAGFVTGLGDNAGEEVGEQIGEEVVESMRNHLGTGPLGAFTPADAQRRKVAPGQEQEAGPRATSSRFNIAELANRIQDSINRNKDSQNLEKMRQNSDDLNDKVDILNDQIGGIAVGHFA